MEYQHVNTSCVMLAVSVCGDTEPLQLKERTDGPQNYIFFTQFILHVGYPKPREWNTLIIYKNVHKYVQKIYTCGI